tara:strand:- start:2850 stop:3821 length:972 start_codon:yes stop_codon:yes gene_type:complete
MEALKVYGPFINRKQAIEQGLKTYFTGKKCRRSGGIAERRTSGHTCLCTNCREFHKRRINKYLKERRANDPEYRRRGNLKQREQYKEDILRLKNNNKDKPGPFYKQKRNSKIPDNVYGPFLSREEAIDRGLRFYFTGIPCKRGHLDLRKVNHQSCISCQRLYSENWDKNHKESRRRDKEKATLKWRLENPELNTVAARMRASINGLIRRGLMNKGNYKSAKIGIKAQEFVSFIEGQFIDGMSWENKNEWDIDHIRPCRSFDLLEKDQCKVCFNYRNLRPLWKKENISKHAKYAPLDELAWVERMQALGYEGELFLKYEEGNSY